MDSLAGRIDSPLFSGFLNFLAERSDSCKAIMVPINEDDIQVITLDIIYIKGVISS
jgi:hypothetical protein